MKLWSLSPVGGQPVLHYSLSLSHSQSDEGAKKEAIATALFDHFESLVEQVDPECTANKLYGIAVLESGEAERFLEGTEPREEQARSLMQLVKRKLWKNPGWFKDVCKVLRACGVKSISQVIGMPSVSDHSMGRSQPHGAVFCHPDDVQKKCPSEEGSLLSSGIHSVCKLSLTRNSCTITAGTYC